MKPNKLPSSITALQADLQTDLPHTEIFFDATTRALYATDASNYRHIPLGVVIPRTVEEMVTVVKLAHQQKIPLLARGAATSLAGQTCNAALVIDTTQYLNRVLRIDSDQRLAWVEAGVVLDTLQKAAAPYQLRFGPDPATHSRCTLGGMIGNNASGAHSLTMGKTVDNVEALEILTYDGLRMWVGNTSETELETIIKTGGQRGTIYAQLKTLRDHYAPLIRAQFPKIPRRVSGYNVDQLLPENGFNVARALVGTEGTCVLILQAMVRLVPQPQQRVLLVLGFDDIYQAGDCVAQILPHQPLCIEGLDADMMTDMRKKGQQMTDIQLLPQGYAWLLVELGGETLEQATEQAHRLVAALKECLVDSRLFTDSTSQQRVWAIREVGAAATNSVPGELETYPGWEDAAVEPRQLGNYLRDFRRLLDQYGYKASLYGHFGEGCIHSRITFDLHSHAGIRQWRAFLEAAADLVVQYGGSLSGEHGDGQARGELLPRMFSKELMQAFAEFKAIWDPLQQMNPGKLIHPYPLDENLRFGTAYQPVTLATHFTFPQDNHNFAQAVARCVGVGKCRRESGGLMCPSYRVTQDENCVTRGRAHLLFEMVRNDFLAADWNQEKIKESLELCLACKGCKRECPVAVDMSTYKAEFMAHYYAHHSRPLFARLVNWLPRGIQWATAFSPMINFFTQTSGIREIVKRSVGIAAQRHIPPLAAQNFTQWFHQRTTHFPPPSRRELGESRNLTVILWADTFNNFFRPATAQAACQVLEACGYQVKIPSVHLCCGRPLYDNGRLDLARQLLQQILDVLRPDILADVPIIGLEPSCMSVFREELLNFFPDDEVAQRLSAQTFLLSDFLVNQPINLPFFTLNRSAIVHGHCHHKAIFNLEAEKQLLARIGLECTFPEAGCCGMAGAFGFDKRYYPLSIKLGEIALLPAVRAANEETLIIADGFSCREQIEQTTGKQVFHSAEVLQWALPPS